MKKILFLLGVIAFFSIIGCDRHKAPMTPTPPEWLRGAVHQQAKAMAPQAEPVGGIFHGTAYDEDDKTQWQLVLDAGKCYFFSAAGDRTVEELELRLRDPTDDEVADVDHDSPRAVLAHCTAMAGLYKVEAKVSEGHGHYALAVYVTDGPAPVAPAPVAPAPAMADLGSVVDKMAKSSAPGAERVGDHFSGTADQTDWYVALEATKCYWFIGAGAEGVSELYLYLWDPDDTRITQNKPDTNRVTVGHCPKRSGMFRFQAKVGSGSGPYKLGVFAKAK